MSLIPKIPLGHFNYDLPTEKIALFPSEPRDHSKMLVFHEGHLIDKHFFELDQVLKGATIITNNTKVIPARLWFENEKGQHIQIFILKPIVADWSVCEVMVGNRKKFKPDDVLKLTDGMHYMEVRWEDRENNWVLLNSSFKSTIDAIEHFGQVPLPPYIEREVEQNDKLSYQAIFAQKEGAVAAPTASLHFTEDLRGKLIDQDCIFKDVTLHVSAGTFKPVTADFADEHEMHAERFEVALELIDHLLEGNLGVVAIGTTATRVLESLYYLGVKAFLGELDDCFISSEDAYNSKYDILSTRDSLECLRKFMLENGGYLKGETQIFIVPGFKFRIVDWMITNFHQPKSTLLLLISAFVGDDWVKIYQHALNGGYRFLSYGDGSLIKGKKNITI